MKGSKFAEALAGEDEVQVSVTGRKSGRGRSLPVWFVVEGNTLHLLPMYGLKTNWYRDIEKSGDFEVQVKKLHMGATPKVVREKAKVERVKKLFAGKYGAGDVRKYYPTSEVALEIET